MKPSFSGKTILQIIEEVKSGASFEISRPYFIEGAKIKGIFDYDAKPIPLDQIFLNFATGEDFQPGNIVTKDGQKEYNLAEIEVMARRVESKVPNMNNSEKIEKSMENGLDDTGSEIFYYNPEVMEAAIKVEQERWREIDEKVRARKKPLDPIEIIDGDLKEMRFILGSDITVIGQIEVVCEAAPSPYSGELEYMKHELIGKAREIGANGIYNYKIQQQYWTEHDLHYRHTRRMHQGRVSGMAVKKISETGEGENVTCPYCHKAFPWFR